MARVKAGTTRRARHNKLRTQAKGFGGFRGRTIKGAKEGLMHALMHAYVGRKLKKRDMKRLWITRISAALSETTTNYSTFIHNMRKNEMVLNRKVLSEIAQYDEKTFKKIVDKVQ